MAIILQPFLTLIFHLYQGLHHIGRDILTTVVDLNSNCSTSIPGNWAPDYDDARIGIADTIDSSDIDTTGRNWVVEKVYANVVYMSFGVQDDPVSRTLCLG